MKQCVALNSVRAHQFPDTNNCQVESKGVTCGAYPHARAFGEEAVVLLHRTSSIGRRRVPMHAADTLPHPPQRVLLVHFACTTRSLITTCAAGESAYERILNIHPGCLPSFHGVVPLLAPHPSRHAGCSVSSRAFCRTNVFLKTVPLYRYLRQALKCVEECVDRIYFID